MRDILHGAVAEAREVVNGVVEDFGDSNAITDDEALAQYAKIWDKPQELIAFAMQYAAPGSDPMTEALRYEEEMYPLFKQRGG